jgi:hypothetical protein
MLRIDFICDTYSFVKEVSRRTALVTIYLPASSFSSLVDLQLVAYNKTNKLVNKKTLFMTLLNGFPVTSGRLPGWLKFVIVGCKKFLVLSS